MFLGGKYVNKINMLTKDRQDRQEKGLSGKARIDILTLNSASTIFKKLFNLRKNALAQNKNML